MGRAHEVRAASMAKTAAAKSKLYAKWAKEIYMAAKSGVPDPDMNASLKRVIERAKKEQVTADVIKRSIEKAKGGTGENYTSVSYQGFGPAGTSFIVECLTDNVSRTVAIVRNSYQKRGGNFGQTVMHQFEHKAILSTNEFNEEQVLEALILNEVDADIEEEDGIVTVLGEYADYNKIKQALFSLKEDINLVDDEVTYIPLNVMEITNPEDIGKIERFIADLDEIEDVQEYYHNAKWVSNEEEE
ncbi:MAG: YebC/PmpR family DNA-binding transcriptional regulator [Acholeplasmatales bacterium]|jgi:YebC/PmpR family DNA-binding regulatory protein|nr:YebC/PmpR family DNA-binding transcriptional regulator [Acholeplasmatales bacterium]